MQHILPCHNENAGYMHNSTTSYTAQAGFTLTAAQPVTIPARGKAFLISQMLVASLTPNHFTV
jgi:hypothetical protein